MQQNTFNLAFVVATVALSLAVGSPLAWQEQARFEMPVVQLQLFLDEQDVAELTKLTRTMHRPVKKWTVSEPALPWEGVLQVRCSPVWDEQQPRYKIWLSSSYAWSAHRLRFVARGFIPLGLMATSNRNEVA